MTASPGGTDPSLLSNFHPPTRAPRHPRVVRLPRDQPPHVVDRELTSHGIRLTGQLVRPALSRQG
jgi:hypothetical protein